MQKTSLNGIWDFVVDMDPKYRSDKRVYPTPCYARPDWDRQHWQQVEVPGVWNKYAERLDIYEGVCWFAREFNVDSLKEDYSARLRFGAVNYLCRIFLNGIEIGQHEGGYTEFVLDAAGHLVEGTNHIAVYVDNRATTIKFPPVLGYFNYGGIHRDVTLEISDNPYFDEVIVEAVPFGDKGNLKIIGSVGKCKGGLTIQLVCENITAVVPVSDDGSFCVKMDIPEVKLWSAKSPELYSYELRLLAGDVIMDSYCSYCGFRKIAVCDGSILLNDQKFAIKGICYVYDSPIYGVCPNTRAIAEDVSLFRELGVNAVRCHYPLSQEFYEAFDRAGIMVWVETPVYCLHPKVDDTGTPFADKAWQELARQMYREMIASARNHPSIVIYGLGNECNTANQEAAKFFCDMAKYVRELDSSRLISYAALYGIIGDVAKVVDVLGINSYWGWYDKVFGGKGLSPDRTNQSNGNTVSKEPIDLTSMRQMLDKALDNKDMALFLTEFGADSIPGYLSETRELWSENYHADLLKEIFKLSDDYDCICGTFPFCFSDYRDPSKPVSSYWDEINYKGVVSYDRQKKLAFKTLAERYEAGD